jgi:hypothetical protein
MIVLLISKYIFDNIIVIKKEKKTKNLSLFQSLLLLLHLYIYFYYSCKFIYIISKLKIKQKNKQIYKISNIQSLVYSILKVVITSRLYLK